MRHKREFHHHGTLVEPDIKMWVNQTAIPAKNDDGWTFSNAYIDEEGHLVFLGSGFEAASRNIPGVMTNHLYKVTITCQAVVDPCPVKLGEVSMGSIAGSSTYIYFVRPVSGNMLRFMRTLSTGKVTVVTIEAMDPIELERIPVL
jgi:hypothetical protein